MIWRVGDCREVQLRNRRDPSMVLQVRLKKRSSSVRLLLEAFGVGCESKEAGFLMEDDVDLKLTGKVALVTGSTAGIGFAIARSLASEGVHVYVNGRTQERVDAAIAAIRSRAVAVEVDGVAADFSGSTGAEAVIAKLPTVDVLVNNVGIFEPKPFAEIPDADWYRFFEINVMSGVRLARHYLRGMLKKNWGRIIFVSSESAVQIPPEMVHYGMTKTAQIAVARGIAESVAGTGVTVNSILAGPTESEGVGAFVEAMAKQQKKSKAKVEKEFFAHVRPSSLLKRFATVDEVAAMATYLAGELSSATNGAALRADGGVVRAIL
jgi:NAD(P)-dependent dehydrogenase (short-subunit alcohol dehydrogenase family)